MAPLSVPKVFMAGGALGFGYYLYMRQYWFPNPYKTQGVQNIEDRFSAGGGSPTHTPAGGSKRGMEVTVLHIDDVCRAWKLIVEQDLVRTMRVDMKAGVRVQTQSTSRETFRISRRL